MFQPELLTAADDVAEAVLDTAYRLAAARIAGEEAVCEAIFAVPTGWSAPPLRLEPQRKLLGGDVLPALVHHLSLPAAWRWCGPLAAETYEQRRQEAAEFVSLAEDHSPVPVPPARWLHWRLGPTTVPGLILGLGSDDRVAFFEYESLVSGHGTYDEAEQELVSRLTGFTGPQRAPPRVTGVTAPWLSRWATHEAGLLVDIPLPVLLASTVAEAGQRPATLRALLGHSGRHPDEDPAVCVAVPLDRARQEVDRWTLLLRRVARGTPLGQAANQRLETIGGSAALQALTAWSGA